MIICPGASIEVTNNRVTEIKSVTEYHTDTQLRENCAHHYEWFTIDSTFEQVERYLYGESINVGSVQVEYDEQYGFPKRFYITNSGIGDLENITITDFQVLD
jgi:hypothetical protein